jgi:hypothetical protein
LTLLAGDLPSRNEKSRPFGTAFGQICGLTHNPVRPLPCFGLRRFDLQPELFDHMPTHKPADAVTLPVGGFGDLHQRCAFLSLHELQDLLRFGYRMACSWPWGPSLSLVRRLLRLGRLLGALRLLGFSSFRRRFLRAHGSSPFLECIGRHIHHSGSEGMRGERRKKTIYAERERVEE